MAEDDGKGEELSYEQAKELARHDDVQVRLSVAERVDIKPEILYFLTDDPAPEVRAALAGNRSTPAQADLILAQDSDQEVRGALAAKVSRLAPQFDPEDQGKIEQIALDTLEILARDEVTRVRCVIAETLKDVAHAPHDVIRKLAWDSEIDVSGPVLEFSPVLTDEDLLDIIEKGTASGRLSRISKRETVPESIVDTIVLTSDEEAIGLLLGNPSAQIREETLNRIVDKAPEVERWHAPLVSRPSLPGSAAVRIARFVADTLLEKLMERDDFAPEVMAEVETVVRERLKVDRANAGETEDTETPLEVAYAKATERHAADRLSEAAILDALTRDDRAFVVASLAVLTGLVPLAMEKAIRSAVAKGIVAIAWKAGLSPYAAERLQTDLCAIAESEILTADDGGFPMSEDDMEWQFEFVAGTE